MTNIPTPTSPIALIVNRGAGRSDATAEISAIADQLRAAGRTVTVALVGDAADIETAVAEALAVGAGMVVAGGGDGTVNGVVAALDGHDIPLGVLPLGTLNHFAKDLGIPVEIEPAVAVLLTGTPKQVDLAEVNGKLFLNNSSLGLYPQVLRIRSRYAASGLGKWLIAAWATLKVTGEDSELTVQLTVDGASVTHRTSLVMVGNNAYRMRGLEAGTRDSLTEGQLAVYIVPPIDRVGLFRLLWRLVRNADPTDHLTVLHAEEVTINPRQRKVDVAYDGEVRRFDAPLTYRIRPLTLRVVAPG